MITKVVSIFSRIFNYINRCGAKVTLSILLPYFSNGNNELAKSLHKKGYCSLLINNPPLLVGRISHERRNPVNIPYSLLLTYLRRIILSGALKCPKGTRMMHLLGIIPFFANCMDNMLESTCREVVKYNVPESRTTGKRVVVYSVITGSYDKVHELICNKGDVDYILFTNNSSLHSDTWDVRHIESDLDDVMLSREVKMLPHKYLGKEFDISIYVDGSAIIYNDISELSAYIDDSCSFAVTKHSERNSVREEIDACVKFKGVDEQVALSQYLRYTKEGFLDDIGLAECTILIRNHNDNQLIELMEEWWKEFCSGVKRDQISLMPCISRNHFNSFQLIGGCVWCNQYCVIGGHAQKWTHLN